METYWSESLPASTLGRAQHSQQLRAGLRHGVGGRGRARDGQLGERALHARAQAIDLDAELGKHSQNDAAGGLCARCGAAGTGRRREQR